MPWCMSENLCRSLPYSTFSVSTTCMWSLNAQECHALTPLSRPLRKGPSCSPPLNYEDPLRYHDPPSEARSVTQCLTLNEESRPPLRGRVRA